MLAIYTGINTITLNGDKLVVSRILFQVQCINVNDVKCCAGTQDVCFLTKSQDQKVNVRLNLISETCLFFIFILYFKYIYI